MAEDKRITVRFNSGEQAELRQLRETFHIEDDSKAVKLAIEWVNSYLKNVSETFFPQSYEVVLVKKKKHSIISRRVF